MDTQQLVQALYSAAMQHVQLPPGMQHAALLGLAAVGLFGLLLMVRGARWAAGLGSLGFLAVGGLGGTHLAGYFGTPLWPTVAVSAAASFVIGLALFRIWQAVILAACCAGAAMTAFYIKDLAPQVSTWLGDGEQVTLPAPGSVVGDATQTAMAQLQSLWGHLGTTVPNFEFNFWTLLVLSGVAGLAFGLLLPRFSKALWAATLGTILLGMSVTGMLGRYAPEQLAWLQANHAAAWGIVGVAWAGSFLYNLLTTGEKKPRISVEDDPNAKSRPAMV